MFATHVNCVTGQEVLIREIVVFVKREIYFGNLHRYFLFIGYEGIGPGSLDTVRFTVKRLSRFLALFFITEADASQQSKGQAIRAQNFVICRDDGRRVGRFFTSRKSPSKKAEGARHMHQNITG